MGIAALGTGPNILKKPGKYRVAAERARMYDFEDINGTQLEPRDKLYRKNNGTNFPLSRTSKFPDFHIPEPSFKVPVLKGYPALGSFAKIRIVGEITLGHFLFPGGGIEFFGCR